MKKLSLGWLQLPNADHNKKQINFVWQCPWRYIILILLIFFAHFSFHSQLGLYEDDWVFIGDVANNTWGENSDRIQWAFQTFWQGRPLHMFFLTFFPWLGLRFGGLNLVYGIGFILVSVNTCLAYTLGVKILPPPYQPLAFLTALFFALYPADTTAPFLTHSLGIQPSLFFVLTATYAYLNSRWAIAYVLATGSLLTYESLFFLFFAAPYLRTDNFIKNGRRHTLILIAILSVYVFLRKLSSEERVANIEPLSAIATLMGRVVLGPMVALGSFFARCWQVWQEITPLELVFLMLLTGLFYGIVHIYVVRLFSQSAPTADRQQRQQLYRIRWVSLALASVLGYCTAIPSHLVVRAIDGRASRVHFAAALGVCLLLALLWGAILLWVGQRRSPLKGITLILAMQLAFLTLFAIQVQGDYRLSWRYQQAFWQDVVTLAPDLKEGTVILVYAPNLIHGTQINYLDWSTFHVLANAINFPVTWQWDLFPRLYVLSPELPLDQVLALVVDQGQRLILSPDNLNNVQVTFNEQGEMTALNADSAFKYPYIEGERVMPTSKVILLVEQGGQLSQVEQVTLGVNELEAMTINFQPKSPQPARLPYPTNRKFNLLTKTVGTDIPRPYLITPQTSQLPTGKP